MIPEPIATKYRTAISGAVHDVAKTYGHIYSRSDLAAKAWAETGELWDSWDSKAWGPGKVRLEMRKLLWHYVEGDLPALGHQRIRTPDGRKWVRKEWPWDPAVFAYAFAHLASDIGIPDAAYVDDGYPDDILWADTPFQRHVEWPAMNGRTWTRFARILFRDHIEVCAAFYALEIQKRPDNRTVAEWVGRVERKRASLRVKYARELAIAKYEALGYGKPEDLAA